MTDDELKSLLAGHSADVRRHFDVAVERIETRVDLVSESIMQVDQKLDRSVTRLAETIESTAAETQAMVRFSHAELDRRVRSREETVASLLTRVERLENSTQQASTQQ